VNKPGKVVGARFKEWLVFQKSPLSLDQTIFNYTLICDCTDGQLNITLSHISYEYETDRTDTGVGQEMTAEQWITDEYALTRNKQKLARYSGKFRSKTIDRKDFIFNRFANLLK
jgi:colicin import membrane protein